MFGEYGTAVLKTAMLCLMSINIAIVRNECKYVVEETNAFTPRYCLFFATPRIFDYFHKQILNTTTMDLSHYLTSYM